jgi:hypothetical protein
MTSRLAELGKPVTTSIVPGFDHELLLIDERREQLIAEEWDRTLAWLRRCTRL